MTRMKSRRGAPPRPSGFMIAAIALLIVLAGLLTYRNSFAGAFVLDDGPAIVDNPNIRRLWPLTSALSAPPEVTVAGRPAVSLTLAINYAWTQLDPWSYHAVNLAIHIAAAMVLFGIARRTLRRVASLRDWSTGLAGAMALIWLVHPIQTGSVTYIVQRAESLMGLCYLLTLYCAIRASESRRPTAWVVGSIACCALGMASKEAMATAPILVWSWDFVFSPRTPHPPSRTALYLGLAATWLLLAALMVTYPRTHSIGFGFAQWPWWRYLATQAQVVVHYLRLTFVPTPLVLDYGWPPVRSFLDVAPQAVFLLAGAVLSAWGVWRRRAAGFAGAAFFLILAPTSSVVPVVTEVAAEHRMYLPLAAIVALAVTGAATLVLRLRTKRAPSILLALTGAVVIACSVAADARNRDYASDETIWLDTVTKRPGNARAHNNYAIDLLARGEDAAAETHLRAAVSIEPDFADAHSNLGVALCRQGRFEEGIAEIERAIALAPAAAHAERDLAEAYAALGRLRPAADHYAKALQHAPDDVFLINRLAWIRATATDDAARNGVEADALARHAVELTGRRDAISLDSLAAALAERGRFDEAASVAQEAIDRAAEQGDERLVAELKERAALYRQGRKFRQ